MTTITGPVRKRQVQLFGMPLSIETRNETAFRKSCVFLQIPDGALALSWDVGFHNRLCHSFDHLGAYLIR